MNRITRIAALLIPLIAAGAAFADDPTPDTSAATVSTVSRAQVLQELAQFKRPGVANPWSTSYNPLRHMQSTRSRDDVRAETVRAMASGEIHAMTAEPASFDGAFVPAARASGLQLARVSR